MEALAVRRVPQSPDLQFQGDYVFIPKREPIRQLDQIPVEPPAGYFRRLWWNWFGQKYITRETILPLWPEIDTTIINCPICNGPSATTKNHKIACIDPLTIESPITCPYCRTFTFKVSEGKIMTA